MVCARPGLPNGFMVMCAGKEVCSSQTDTVSHLCYITAFVLSPVVEGGDALGEQHLDVEDEPLLL